jgi:hypothetical protein
VLRGTTSIRRILTTKYTKEHKGDISSALSSRPSSGFGCNGPPVPFYFFSGQRSAFGVLLFQTLIAKSCRLIFFGKYSLATSAAISCGDFHRSSPSLSDQCPLTTPGEIVWLIIRVRQIRVKRQSSRTLLLFQSKILRKAPAKIATPIAMLGISIINKTNKSDIWSVKNSPVKMNTSGIPPKNTPARIIPNKTNGSRVL